MNKSPFSFIRTARCSLTFHESLGHYHMKTRWCGLQLTINQTNWIRPHFAVKETKAKWNNLPKGFVLSVRGQVKVYFSNDSQNVNRQRLRMVSFTFKGAEAGWVTAQRHTNECVPRVFTLLSTHTMWPFIALSCASVAPASSVSTRWRGRPRLE